jgi:hypothetical protein
MFAGTFQDKVIARLPARERERAITGGARRFEPMPGRPMKGAGTRVRGDAA